MENFNGLRPIAAADNNAISPTQHEKLYDTVGVLGSLAVRHINDVAEGIDSSGVPGISLDDVERDDDGAVFSYVLDDKIYDILDIPQGSIFVFRIRFTGDETSVPESACILSPDESRTRPAGSRSVEELQEQLADLKRYVASIN